MGNKPKVLKTTPFTSKSVAVEIDALEPKFHKYWVKLGPVICPSKLKLFPVMHNESLFVKVIESNSFKLIVATAVSEHPGAELPIKVTSKIPGEGYVYVGAN
ncbi:MAG: hypothetical protein RJA13_1889 [Bacteroidota bacterium]